jgi:hypothetical protein
MNRVSVPYLPSALELNQEPRCVIFHGFSRLVVSPGSASPDVSAKQLRRFPNHLERPAQAKNAEQIDNSL